MAATRDGARIATLSERGVVSILSAANGNVLGTFRLPSAGEGGYDPWSMINERSSALPYSLDYLDLFIHGLLDWSTSVYFDMSLAVHILEGKHLIYGQDQFISIGSQEFEFILGYVQFLLTRDLARLDVDLFMHLWDDYEVVGRFIAPLTLRGRELAQSIAEISDKFTLNGISVVQDKYFTGLDDFEVSRRVVVVETFKTSMGYGREP